MNDEPATDSYGNSQQQNLNDVTAVQDTTMDTGNLSFLEDDFPPQTMSQTSRTKVAIAVDPVALITTECVTVTSAMRKHSRWAHSSASAILSGAGASRIYDRESSRPGTPRNGKAGTPTRARIAPAPGGTLKDDGDDSLANRWGLRGKKGKSIQDNPLMSAFAHLRSDLNGCRDITEFDTPSLLHPFLQVIRSSSTSAPITSLALAAIRKFFAYKIITIDSPRISLAMHLLSAAITHCRFEATDSSADEIVLLRILNLMELMLSGPEGSVLGDESVCEMMETGLSMCCQARLSEVLRRSAEMAMVNMCQAIFERLKHLQIEAKPLPGSVPDPAADQDASSVKMEPSVDGTTVTSQNPSALGGDMSAGKERTSDEQVSATPASGSAVSLPKAIQDLSLEDTKPYGLPSIRELFRVLIDLLDPHNRQHTDTMRIMALRILDVALEVAGPSIAKHPSLAQLAEDDLCRHLFQLVRSENMSLLNGSLRVTGTLLSTCREVLKLQQELYLSYLVACLHPRVEIPAEPGIDPSLYEGVPQAPKLVKPPPSQSSSGRSTPVPVKDRQKLGMEGGSRKPDAREAMVESIGALARIPSFMVELFVNYDCEIDRADLCEDMVGLLSRNAFPDSATWSTTNVPPLCLDALLGYVNFIAERLEHEPNYENVPDAVQLKAQRDRKRVIIRGATKFNENPKAGVAFLAAHGIIEDPNDPLLVASFLRGTTRVSKKVLGDFISKKSNDKILTAFIDTFDFDGKTVDGALRELLGSFRLPGESALIERIVTVFSEKYLNSKVPEGVADSDSMFVLTYAIIMLNTDLYNPNVKTQNRMSYEAFARNLRGVNAGNDFAPEFLQAIYDAIKHSEIILPEEHDNKHAFDYAWKELLMKTDSSGDLAICNTNIFDAEMFKATWKPIVATLSYVFMSASDDAVFSRVVIGFDQCAQIAAKHGLTEALDRIIYCLSSITNLATDQLTNTSLNTEVQVSEKSVMVSELAVKLGRDFRGQLATVVLFRLLAGNEAVVHTGWKHIIRILLNFFVNSLIPPFSTDMLAGMQLPPIPLQTPAQVIDRDGRGNEGSIFSAFTSYLSSYAADDPPEPSDEELENTLCTVDCVTACPIDEIIFNLRSLPPRSISNLISLLLAELPEETGPAVIVVKPERPAANPPRQNGQRRIPDGPIYNPRMLYVLELATLLATQNKETLEETGEALTSNLQNLVRDASNLHPMIVSRVVYYLLELLRVSFEFDYMRTPVVLHNISSFDQAQLDEAGELVMNGLIRCIKDSEDLERELTNSPDFWSILQRLVEHKTAAPLVLEVLQTVVTANPPIITADNYEAAVTLANDFATAGKVGAVREIRKDGRGNRTKLLRQLKAKDNEVVARGVKAIGLIYTLTGQTSNFIKQSHLEEQEAWAAYWSPIFGSLSRQCVNPCREIRHQATSALQRSLLSPQLASTNHTEWIAIFGEVLFPLINRLLKPEVYQSDPTGMSETRVQAATLLCKIFLHYLVLLSEWDGMLDLWLKILDVLDRMMNSGQGDSLDEAVPESLKNILLVMSSDNYLVPPSQTEDAAKQKLWTETRKRLQRFLPELFDEIFPEAKNGPVQPQLPVDEAKVEEPIAEPETKEAEKSEEKA